MPGLIAFGRRWGIGTDDLVFPGAMEVGMRLAWLLAISIVFHLHKEAFDCLGGDLLQAYYIGVLLFLSIHIVGTAVIIYTSMQGTITNTWPRKRIPKFIYLKLILSFPELFWLILGTNWAFSDSSSCEKHVVLTVKGAVLTGWGVGLLVLIGVLIIFDPHGRKTGSGMAGSGVAGSSLAGAGIEDEETAHGGDERRQLIAGSNGSRIWELRCKLMCCCVGYDEHSKDAFSNIAQVFSDFFQDVDLVPTDIAAGLILVQIEQEKQTVMKQLSPLNQEQPSTSQQALSSPSSGVAPSGGSPLNKSAWMDISVVAHYAKYAMAAYGWPLYMFTHLATGCFRLWGNCRCCSCRQSSDVLEDNCCQCNMASIKNTIGVEDIDVIYASFHNKVYEIPFYIVLDHKQKAVVVAVRGTLSLRDVLTDLTADYECVDVDDVEDCHAHKGMNQAAKYIQTKIQQDQLLEQAFIRAQNYQLVLTGHSLGAGVASLLSILLRPTYPDLVCYAYSPPGGLLSPSAAKHTEDYICSVVLGQDIVPRLGIVTMENFKVKLLQVIKDSNKPKYKILAGGLWYVLCGFPNATEEEELSDQRRHLLEEASPTSALNYSCSSSDLQQALQEAIQSSGRSCITHKRLYLPGNIMHITEEEPSSSWWGTPHYQVSWSSAESFNEIIVSPKMVANHMPDAVARALDQLAERNTNPRHRRPQQQQHEGDFSYSRVEEV